MTVVLVIAAANVAAWPFARRLARWTIRRELTRDLRRELDAWGDTHRR
jgi:hypothetical protein